MKLTYDQVDSTCVHLKAVRTYTFALRDALKAGDTKAANRAFDHAVIALEECGVLMDGDDPWGDDEEA